MLGIYRVTNTAGNGIWVVANDPDSARVYAVQKKHGRSALNLRAYLVTEDFDGFDLSNLTPGILVIEHDGDGGSALKIIP